MDNKYIVFKFKSWDEKHPICEIVQTIGDVGKLENFMSINCIVKVCMLPYRILEKNNKGFKGKSEEALLKK